MSQIFNLFKDSFLLVRAFRSCTFDSTSNQLDRSSYIRCIDWWYSQVVMCWCVTMQLVTWHRYISPKLRKGQTLYSRFSKLHFLLDGRIPWEKSIQQVFEAFTVSKHISCIIAGEVDLQGSKNQWKFLRKGGWHSMYLHALHMQQCLLWLGDASLIESITSFIWISGYVNQIGWWFSF